MRITVRVRPGASRPSVGGQYGAAGAGQAPVLLVSVAERAVDGAATDAVLSAVADALGARRSALSVVTGHRSRTKVLLVDPEPEGAKARLAELLAGD